MLKLDQYMNVKNNERRIKHIKNKISWFTIVAARGPQEQKEE